MHDIFQKFPRKHMLLYPCTLKMESMMLISTCAKCLSHTLTENRGPSVFTVRLNVSISRTTLVFIVQSRIKLTFEYRAQLFKHG